LAIASQFFPARNEVDTASTGLSSHTQVMVPAYSGQGRNQGKDAFGWPEPWQHFHGYFQVSKHSKAMNSFQANMLRDVPDMLCFQKQLNHAMQLIESSAVLFMHFSCKIIDNSIPPPECRVSPISLQAPPNSVPLQRGLEAWFTLWWR